MRALASDVTLVCLGLSPLIEGEEGAAILSAENGDRSDIGLPAPQADFLRALAQTGAKIVLILTGGSPLALGPLADMMEAIFTSGTRARRVAGPWPTCSLARLSRRASCP